MKKVLALMMSFILIAVFTVSASGNTLKNSQTASRISSNTSKDRLIMGTTSLIESMNIAEGQNACDFVIRRCLYDPLIYCDLLTNAITPRIAERYQISSNKLVYTFYIRKGIKMHDGSTLNAKDVKFSLDLTKASPDVGKNLLSMKSAVIVNANTVKVTLNAPSQGFLKCISNVFIQSEAAYKKLGKTNYNKAPVGSGPYKFVSYADGTKLVLTRFDKYYRSPAPIKNIEIRLFSDSSALAVAMRSGEIDAATPIVPANYSDLKKSGNITVTKNDTTKFCLAIMNCNFKPFDNTLVRQAINYALDRQFILDSCREGIGKATSVIFSSSLLCSRHAFEYKYNPEKAKQLLKQAGIKLPYQAPFKLSTYGGCKAEAEAVQACLANIGFNVQIEILQAGALYGGFAQGTIPFSIARMGTALNIEDQYTDMFTKNGFGGINYARFSNDEITSLFNKANTEANSSKRITAYRKVLDKIQVQVPYAMIYEMPDLNASKKDLNTKWGYNGLYYLYDFSWK